MVKVSQAERKLRQVQLKINELVVSLARQDTDARGLVDALRMKFTDQERTVERLAEVVAASAFSSTRTSSRSSRS